MTGAESGSRPRGRTLAQSLDHQDPARDAHELEIARVHAPLGLLEAHATIEPLRGILRMRDERHLPAAEVACEGLGVSEQPGPDARASEPRRNVDLLDVERVRRRDRIDASPDPLPPPRPRGSGRAERAQRGEGERAAGPRVPRRDTPLQDADRDALLLRDQRPVPPFEAASRAGEREPEATRRRFASEERHGFPPRRAMDEAGHVVHVRLGGRANA